jgi:hypothetical protein
MQKTAGEEARTRFRTVTLFRSSDKLRYVSAVFYGDRALTRAAE